MLSTSQVLGFAVTCLIVIAIPGPSVLFVIGRALAYGRRTALASVAGNVAGVQVVAMSVALGVGTLVQRSDTVFGVVKFGGAAYLVWLGVKAIRHRRSLESVIVVAAAPRGARRAAAEGFTVGVANPKAYVLFAAVLPQFANPSAGHVPLQLLLLSLVSLPIALISDGTWGLAASGARAWFARSPRRLELVGGLGGLTMIGLGVTLALTGRRD
ncbi:MAG TPA: LysE family translocator [Streptosporangiaceae bacterium]